VELIGNIEELQKISDYRTIRKTLRPAGIGSIVFGVLAVVMGIASIEDNSLNAILALIGLFLLVEGIWLVVSPTPKGMIVDGIALIILGLWNILITIANASAGSGEPSSFALIGVLQIIWGFQSFKRFKRFSGVSMEKPSEESLQRVDELVKSIRSSKPKNESDIIQFQTSGFQSSIWKGKLFTNASVFVTIKGQETIITRKEDVNILAEEKVLIGKSLKALYKFGSRDFKGTIPPEFYERYVAWKTGIITDDKIQR
jgi:uncharacterized protein YjeT (DUF2065 family)